MDPTALLSALNNIKKTVDYGFQLKSASEESRNAIKTLRVVSGPLNELKRMAVQLDGHLDPYQQEEVDAIICRTNEVIALMAEPNKRSVKDVERFGTVTIYRRIMWTLRDGETIKSYMPDLQLCLNGLHFWTHRLSDIKRDLGQTPLTARFNVWDDTSTLAPDSPSGLRRRSSSRSAVLKPDDLNNERFWDDWFRDDQSERSAGSAQSQSRSRHRHKHDNSSTSRPLPKSDPEQDLAWLGDHAENEYRDRSQQGGGSPRHPSNKDSGDLLWIIDHFEKTEEANRKHRRKSMD